MTNILSGFTIVLLLVYIPASAQKKIILSVYTGSGISMFAGPGSVKNSTYNISDVSAIPNSVAEHYGQKSLTNFLAGLQTRIQLKNNWMSLLNTQYEYAGGRLNINKVISRMGFRDTTGEYKKWFHFISINPEFGKILYNQKINLAMTVGFDYALKLKEDEEYKFINKNGSESVTRSNASIAGGNDIRITAGVLLFIKRWTLHLNYKYGIQNYNEGSNDEAYSRILQVQVMFALLDRKW